MVSAVINWTAFGICEAELTSMHDVTGGGFEDSADQVGRALFVDAGDVSTLQEQMGFPPKDVGPEGHMLSRDIHAAMHQYVLHQRTGEVCPSHSITGNRTVAIGPQTIQKHLIAGYGREKLVEVVVCWGKELREPIRSNAWRFKAHTCFTAFFADDETDCAGNGECMQCGGSQ